VFRIGIASFTGPRALLLNLLCHELDRGLRVPVLIHVGFFLVSRQKAIQTLHHIDQEMIVIWTSID